MENNENLGISSIVGNGGKFIGDLEVEGQLRIDGLFSGTVRKATTVLIGQGGRVEGSLHGRTLVNAGFTRGNIYATSLVHLVAGSLTLGSIFAPRIVVEEGAMLHGSMSITNPRRIAREKEIEAKQAQNRKQNAVQSPKRNRRFFPSSLEQK